MESQVYLTFVFTAIILIVIPGLNVLTIVATSITHGVHRGLQTVLGTASAMLMQLLVAALATTTFVNLLGAGLLWLQWAGACYLLYLGLTHIQALRRFSEDATPAVGAAGSFRRGFMVSLTNPKTIVFFVAFLPQFISDANAYHWQLAVLSLTFFVLATLLDALYAVFSGLLLGLTKSSEVHRVRHALSGAIFIGAAVLLALR